MGNQNVRDVLAICNGKRVGNRRKATEPRRGKLSGFVLPKQYCDGNLPAVGASAQNGRDPILLLNCKTHRAEQAIALLSEDKAGLRFGACPAVQMTGPSRWFVRCKKAF